MAYGTKYRIQWANDRASYRVKLQQDGYSSGVTDLTPAKKPFTVTWNQQKKEDLTLPLKISTATIRFRGDSTGSQVKEIFDAGDTEWRVIFQRDKGGGYSKEWQGFLATDLWQDNPHRKTETIEVEAIDGLALLENQDYDPPSGEFLYDQARNILRSLHNLNVAANMEWYPYRSGNQLSSSELPLGALSTEKNTFDELEPIEGKDRFRTTDNRNKRRVLEAILERFGMELFQNRGEWVIRQRSQIQSNATIKVWPNKSAVTNDNPTTRDLSQSLVNIKSSQTPRRLVRRLRSAESVHKYQNLGELVQNPSFENSLVRWTKTAPRNTISRRQDYSNNNVRTPTQRDSKAFLLRADYDSATNDVEEPTVEQNLPAINHFAGPEAAYQVQWDLAIETKQAVPKAQIRGTSQSGSTYYAKAIEKTVQEPVDAAEDGSVVVDPLPGSDNNLVLPKGSRLFVLGSGFKFTTIQLSENAYAGDEILRGSISSRIKTDNNQRVVCWVWSVNPNTLSGIEETPSYPSIAPALVRQRILLPQLTPNGDKITDDLTLTFSAGAASDNSEPLVWIDHVSVRLFVDNSPIEKTSYTALDDQNGREIEIAQLLGDGPTVDHPRALQLSGVDVTKDWQVGAYASGASRSGQLIEEVTAEAAMRQQRDTLQRRTHSLSLRNEEVWPESVFTINSDLYTVSYLKRTFAGEETAKVELTRLKDAGTLGLVRSFEMGSGDDDDTRFVSPGASPAGPEESFRGEVTVAKAQDDINSGQKKLARKQSHLLYVPNNIDEISKVEYRLADSGGLEGSESVQTLSQYETTAGDGIEDAAEPSNDLFNLDGEQAEIWRRANTLEYFGSTSSDDTFTITSVNDSSTANNTEVVVKSVPSGIDQDGEARADLYALEVPTAGGAPRQVRLTVTFTDGVEVSKIFIIDPEKTPSEKTATGSGGLVAKSDLSDNETLFAQGLDSQDDGDGGVFYYDPNDTSSTADGVNVLDPTNVPGRLKRAAKNVPKADKVRLADSTTQPSQNGEFRNDGGSVYVYTNGTAKNLDNIGSGGGASQLTDLSDVSGATQTDGRVLASGGSDYRDEDLASMVGSHVELGDLSDVGTADATDGDVLIGDGTDYDSTPLATAAGNHLDLSDLSSAAHSSLSGISSSDHHSRYTDSEAIAAINNDADHGSTASHNYFSGSHNDLSNVGSSDHHTRYSDSEAISAINNDTDHGSTASHNYFSGSHDDLTNVSSNDHHERYDDGEAVSAVQSTSSLDITGSAGFSVQGVYENTLGSGDGEAMRWASGSADFMLSLQEGLGRQAWSWNAYFDTSANSGAGGWRLQVGSEDAILYGANVTDLGAQSGSDESFAIGVFGEAGETADTLISWDQKYFFDATGLGIGTNAPSYALEVSGDARATGEVEAFLSSDRRLKQDLDPLSKPLEKVQALTGYGFQWHDRGAVQPHKRGNADVGLVAQEVERVLPEAVRKLKSGHSDGYKGVQYDKLVPLLVEAIKDLQSQVQALQ